MNLNKINLTLNWIITFMIIVTLISFAVIAILLNKIDTTLILIMVGFITGWDLMLQDIRENGEDK